MGELSLLLQECNHRQLLRDFCGSACKASAHPPGQSATCCAKIEAESARPKHVLTDPGVGYRLPHPARAVARYSGAGIKATLLRSCIEGTPRTL